MLKKDVIVIGGGCAGMVAALEAHAAGARVVIIDRGPIGMGTNSALAGGGFAGPTRHYDTEDFVKDTLQTGKGINRESMVRLTAKEAPHAFSFLCSLGLDLEERSSGYHVKSPRDDLIPGVTLVKVLTARIRDLSAIDVLTGFYVTHIMKDEEKVYGVKGFNKEGQEVYINAPAVVLATGGAGAIYLRSDNQKGIMGQGYYLAAKAGLELWDMEFVQFHPIVIAQPGLPSTLFLARPREARLINANGDDLAKKYSIDDILKATITRRDELSAILFKEGLKGPVYMDCRNVPVSFWNRHPLRRIKFDFKREPLAVSPAVHFFMGGVRIDESGQTSLPGLFACGEVVWGLHGANRRGGNALTECVVFGRIAGRNAARHALTHRISQSTPMELPKDFPHRPSSRGMLKELRRQIRETAWKYAGVVRSAKGLSDGLAKIIELEGELKELAPHTITDRKIKEDLLSASFVLKAVLVASISRQESRGSFIREDFPQTDDLIWRRNSCLTYDWGKSKFSLTYYPSS
jgi:succinate dehydrogenase/fumarate reductase flavoprotein subunit